MLSIFHKPLAWESRACHPDRAMHASRAQLRLRRLQAEAYLNLCRIHREIDRKMAALLEEYGLSDVTPAQVNVLTVLYQAQRPMTARELAGMLALSEVTVGRFVRALEQAKWVERQVDPDDNRAILVRPTRKAQNALPRFIALSNAMLDLAFDGFKVGDVRRMASHVEQVRKNLEG